jgi:hypothetical protein
MEPESRRRGRSHLRCQAKALAGVRASTVSSYHAMAQSASRMLAVPTDEHQQATGLMRSRRDRATPGPVAASDHTPGKEDGMRARLERYLAHAGGGVLPRRDHRDASRACGRERCTMPYEVSVITAEPGSSARTLA